MMDMDINNIKSQNKKARLSLGLNGPVVNKKVNLERSPKMPKNSPGKDKVKVTPSKKTQQRSEAITAPAGDAVGCMEGMSGAELAMVRRLAGNDPMVRKKTLKKLKKWLTVLSQKVPDAQDCRSIIEPNFIRVWKALFYCMWMADKPLPQEQLADSLSDLQTIFASKTQPFLLFVEWFIRTIAREWNWIDRFRMDKFMMLFRRFLRQSLLVIAEKKWHNDILMGYLNIVSMHIFNRHPPSKGKKQMTVTPAPAPVGLQIHFIDVFMEELAKVGGEQLKPQKSLKILTVFMEQLGHSSDDRLLDEIRERIFNHLMRQSDVGMDYQEFLASGDADEEEVEDESEEEAGEEDEEEEPIDDIEEDLEMDDPVSNGVLDPRAGMDVILPQLDIDYEKLYQKLIEFGGQKDVKLKNRRILYSLASQFKELTIGKYPLALPEDNYTGAPIPDKEIHKAAKRLMEEEGGELGGKRRPTKKERKREAKRRLNASSTSADSVGSEDNSKYINDEELLDHVTDNYMSYLEDEMEPNQDGSNENSDDVEQTETQEDIPDGKVKKGKKLKKDKNRKRKYETVVEVEAEENSNENGMIDTIAEDDSQNDQEEEETILIKRPKIRKRSSLGSNDKPKTPLLGKVRRLSELRTPNNKSSPLNTSLNSSAVKRRVSFVLARNLEHEHADYSDSIARSPSIPFDRNRRPSFGLLKSPATTPRSTPIKRATALDFF